MSLTTEQQATLAADIEADSAFDDLPHNSDGAFAVADAYNLPAVPTFTVWKTNMSTDDVRKAVVWTEYIAATDQGERDAFNLITQNGIVDASDINIRQGFADIFSGPQKAVTRGNLVVQAKRSATRAEALLADGDGLTSTATMTFEGSLSYRDVQTAMGW